MVSPDALWLSQGVAVSQGLTRVTATGATQARQVTGTVLPRQDKILPLVTLRQVTVTSKACELSYPQ